MIEHRQLAYWNEEGASKTFTHPLRIEWLEEFLGRGGRILDYGCGYGRIAALLDEHGYEVVGVDVAAAMIEKARRLHPQLAFRQIDPAKVPFADGYFDAAVLFAVLTCIPSDEDQKAAVDEMYRVVRPGGLLYVSDYWLQADERNRERYARGLEKHGTYGVFEVADGVAVRHHSRQWIAELFRSWEPIAASDITVTTMNGHDAAGLQWLGRRPME